MMLFKGAATAILTPFTPSGESIDYPTLEKLINWQIEHHIDAIVVAGTTGETVSLTQEEHKELIRFTVSTVNGRVPVLAGTGTNNTRHVVAMTQFAKQAGADAALIVNPYYNKSTQKGLVAHYTAIHDETNIPIVLYNVPSRTGMNIAPETVLALSRLKRIIGIKEASNQFQHITEIKRLVASDFAIYSGNDDTVIPLMALGGSGVISVAGNIIPDAMHQMVTAFLKGNYEEALSLQLSYKPLIDSLFLETNPSPVKKASELLGRNLGPLRLPMVAVDDKTEEALKREIEALVLQKGWF